MKKTHRNIFTGICAMVICTLGLSACRGQSADNAAAPALTAEEAPEPEQTEETSEEPKKEGMSETEQTAMKPGAEQTEGTSETSQENNKPTLDELVANAILAEERGRYAKAECQGEGHIILDTSKEEQDGMTKLTVYTLAMYGEYQFQDGNFVKESGSGVIPTVLTFSVNDKEEYTLEDYQVPVDGSGYVDSIHELFPRKYWDICITPGEERHDALKAQEQAYAAAYLKEIGRTARIGDYGDFEHILLTDQGVSVEVSNQMVEKKELGDYPFWIGNIERLEDGVRYRYSMELEKDKHTILYEKYDLDAGKAVETYLFDSITGEPQG